MNKYRWLLIIYIHCIHFTMRQGEKKKRALRFIIINSWKRCFFFCVRKLRCMWKQFWIYWIWSKWEKKKLSAMHIFFFFFHLPFKINYITSHCTVGVFFRICRGFFLSAQTKSFPLCLFSFLSSYCVIFFFIARFERMHTLICNIKFATRSSWKWSIYLFRFQTKRKQICAWFCYSNASIYNEICKSYVTKEMKKKWKKKKSARVTAAGKTHW